MTRSGVRRWSARTAFPPKNGRSGGRVGGVQEDDGGALAGVAPAGLAADWCDGAWGAGVRARGEDVSLDDEGGVVRTLSVAELGGPSVGGQEGFLGQIEGDRDLGAGAAKVVGLADVAARWIGVGPNYMTALKKAAGVLGRLVSGQALLKDRRQHPGFTTRAAVEAAIMDGPVRLAPATAALSRELRDSRPDRRYAASGRSGGSTH